MFLGTSASPMRLDIHPRFQQKRQGEGGLLSVFTDLLSLLDTHPWKLHWSSHFPASLQTT